jgi:hypothetical protein
MEGHLNVDGMYLSLLNVRLIIELYNLLYLEENSLEGRKGW